MITRRRFLGGVCGLAALAVLPPIPHVPRVARAESVELPSATLTVENVFDATAFGDTTKQYFAGIRHITYIASNTDILRVYVDGQEIPPDSDLYLDWRQAITWEPV